MEYPDTNREVRVTTNGLHWFNAIYDCINDDDHNYAWQATSDDYPPCWTDGVCWYRNEDNEVSVQVIDWRDIDWSYDL